MANFALALCGASLAIKFWREVANSVYELMDAMVNLGSLPEVYMTFTVCEFISLVKLC